MTDKVAAPLPAGHPIEGLNRLPRCPECKSADIVQDYVRSAAFDPGWTCMQCRHRFAVPIVETGAPAKLFEGLRRDLELQHDYDTLKAKYEALLAQQPAPVSAGHPQQLEVECLTPLTRFVRRSRVKPTDEQIAYAESLIEKLRSLIAPVSAGEIRSLHPQNEKDDLSRVEPGATISSAGSTATSTKGD